MRFIKNRINLLRQRISEKFILPERFKGTVVEKWTIYWKAVVRDYTDVSINVVKESYHNPKRALAYVAGSYGLYSCVQRNPNEKVFMCQLRDNTNRLITVVPEMQNKQTVAYLNRLERAINQNTIRLFSLGLFTLLWIDKYDADDCTYPAICEYTKIGIWDYHTRIVDIGFWNQFWRLQWMCQNYDINYL